MNAWIVDVCRPIDEQPLQRVQREAVKPGPGEIAVNISCCGVCRTDLHLAEGDLNPRRHGVVPGHEIVGTVANIGAGVSNLSVGDRVGVPWLGHVDGSCEYCRSGRENLCRAPVFTGWDRDGGYADSCVAAAAFTYRLPASLTDEQAAPLLCAGVIGYRALMASTVQPGDALAIYGFGGSAHLTTQVALHLGMRVHVLTRGAENRRLAKQLGVDSVGPADGRPPEPVQGSILFAPVGNLVPAALTHLDAGGTLAIAGIHLSDIPTLNYAAHLFRERSIRSVTANTRQDGERFLALADRFHIVPTTIGYPMAQAPHALADLAHGRFSGAAVLHNH